MFKFKIFPPNINLRKKKSDNLVLILNLFPALVGQTSMTGQKDHVDSLSLLFHSFVKQ